MQWRQSADALDSKPSRPKAFGLGMRSFSTSSIALGNQESLSGPLQRLLTFDLPNGPTRQMELDATVCVCCIQCRCVGSSSCSPHAATAA